jgi:broad specificity phosphatase PhoE
METAAMQTTRVLLVRHGTTALGAEDRFAGSTDVPLADEGREQAERLARRLASEPLVAVYASPMQRTMETATIVARPHDLGPVARDGLREINHGHWEGLRRREVEERFAEEYAAWEEDPLTCAPEGGEPGISVMARSLPVLHAFDARGYRDRLDQHPCCLNILEFKGAARARLMLFNDVSHYAGAPGRPHGRLSRWWDPS